MTERITLLDGGMGHELKQRGISDGTFVAGALANESQPGVVEAIHHDFFAAGCDVVTTNSFVAVPPRMLECGLAVDAEEANVRASQLITASVKRAKETTRQYGGTRKVAGCVPPLTECYMANEVPDKAEALVPGYEVILSSLIKESVDVLIAETLTTSREAEAIICALSSVLKKQPGSTSIPFWLSFTVDDHRPTALRSGESLVHAIAKVFDKIETSNIHLGAVGVNCSAPRALSVAVPTIVELIKTSSKTPPPRVIVYGNAFQTTTSDWIRSLDGASEGGSSDDAPTTNSLKSPDDDYDENGYMLPDVYARYALEWANTGASIIGGCCGCSPEHMRAVAALLHPVVND